MTTFSYTETLQVETCWCGIAHAIPRNLARQAEEHGKQIYCPLGHTWVVTETVEQKLEKERQARIRAENRAQANRDLLEAEERSHAATRGVVTRQKNKLQRVTNGVCPCCNRTFQNLARHMGTKHPEYAPTITPP